jgi:hypothetical protein
MGGTAAAPISSGVQGVPPFLGRYTLDTPQPRPRRRIPGQAGESAVVHDVPHALPRVAV